MAKRNRPKISTTDKSNVEDALNIAESIVNKPEKMKKAPSKRFDIRIPQHLFERLQTASELTGLSKTAIILKGLYSELNELDKK